MSNFISMAQMFPDIVDCRYLHLEMDFYLLDQQRLNGLADYLARQMIALTGNSFYTVWDFNRRRVKPEALSEKILSSTKYVLFGFEGAVLGDLVYDRKSYMQYEQFLKGPDLFSVFFGWQRDCDISVDYRDVFSQCFFNASSDEEYKKALLHIFNEPAKKNLAVWRRYDTTCMFHSCPHEQYADLYYGTFNFCVAYACLGPDGTSISNILAEIARQAAQEYVNVNARVALTPCFPHESCSGHQRYFYSFPKDYVPIRSDFSPLETRKFFYSPGAEWFNILSPLQLSHVSFLERDAEIYPRIALESLPGGGKAIGLKKPVDETDVADLAEIKRLIYNALLPGRTVMKLKDLLGPDFTSYMCKPRLQWELVPVFEDELAVFAGYVVFSHVSN